MPELVELYCNAHPVNNRAENEHYTESSEVYANWPGGAQPHGGNGSALQNNFVTHNDSHEPNCTEQLGLPVQTGASRQDSQGGVIDQHDGIPSEAQMDSDGSLDSDEDDEDDVDAERFEDGELKTYFS